jgi:hypothetical protein
MYIHGWVRYILMPRLGVDLVGMGMLLVNFVG